MANTTKSDAECEAAIKQFVEITRTNEAEAHSILQDVDYEVEEAITRYFSALESGPLPAEIIPVRSNRFSPKRVSTILESAPLSSATTPLKSNQFSPKRTRTTLESGFFSSATTPLKSTRFSPKRASTTLEFEGEPPAKQTRMNDYFFGSDSTADEEQPGPSASSSRASEIDANARFPPDVTVLSYNIDGLDQESLEIRFTGVLTIVAKVNPDIIFFQEFVKELEPKMRSLLAKNYEIFTGECGIHYYTVTCVAKCIRVGKNEVLKFYSSQMGRNMLCVEGKWRELNVRLINSHLESCWDQAEVRKIQFSQAMEKMREYSSDPDTLSIFGGDLNLRDPEVSNVPEGVQDVWIAAGSDLSLKYTWDTKLNDNKQTKKPVRNRFDRFYAKCPYKKMEFKLEGRQRIKSCGRFPSDHFAIVTKFSAPKLD